MSAPTSAATRDPPHVASSTPGRLRLRTRLDPALARGVESRLAELPGVLSAEANPATGGVLVRYDASSVGPQQVLRAVAEARPASSVAWRRRRIPRLTAIEDRAGRLRKLRIAVPGLDRDPAVARAVVARLRVHPAVHRAVASPLTGRVLVELRSGTVELQDILAGLVDVDLPDLPPDDAPSHPLDVEPLVLAAARLAGAAAGLATVAASRAVGGGEALRSGPAAWAAATVGTVEGFPPLRTLARSVLGRRGSDGLFAAVGVTALTFAGNPLGLAVTAAGALRALSEVRARRDAWRRYETATAGETPEPGAAVRLSAGDVAPLDGTLRDGRGTATDLLGLPRTVGPGAVVHAGSALHGGPFLLELHESLSGRIGVPPRPASTLVERYADAVGPAALAYALLTGALTRSWRRTLIAFILVNPRPALIGAAAAARGASARSLRAGATVVGRRPRALELPHTLVAAGLRPLTDGFEVSSLRTLTPDADAAALLATAAAVSAAAGDPWGRAFGRGPEPATAGTFEDAVASADLRGATWQLAAVERAGAPLTLELRRAGEARALIELRPRPAGGLAELLSTARAHGTSVVVAQRAPPRWAVELATRGGVALDDRDAATVVREEQAAGCRVALLTDAATTAEACATADLTIALTRDRRGLFAAPADVLAPDLGTVCAVLDALGRSRAASRDAVGCSVAANVAGAVWGLRGAPGVLRASTAVHLGALAAVVDAFVRLRGGERAASLAQLVDPQPERWGGRPLETVLRDLGTSPRGLTAAEATARRRRAEETGGAGPLRAAVESQLASPLTALLGGAALASLVLGTVGDVAVIAAVIAANVAVGAWQERQAGEAAAALGRLSSPHATVLRDGARTVVPAADVVAGDVLLLAPGDRVAADARLLRTSRLEVDESSLTGESQPVAKGADAASPGDRIVLAGSDVTVGRGLAVVVAAGSRTRLGAVAAALELAGRRQSGLGARLDAMLREILPVVGAGGALVLGAGLLWRRPPRPQLTVAASAAIAALPEGLPLLAGVAEAAAARRLAGRGGLVRRLASIEALGRVDIACVDKTGTLTEGRLRLALVADAGGRESAPDGPLDDSLRAVVAAAALASPHPSSPEARAHPTDRAVVEAAERCGVDAGSLGREAESPFDPARGFHATAAHGRVAVKGAPETLAGRCALDEDGRRRLLATADALAERGLRVLLVCDADGGDVDDPRNLTPLGFLGIADPLRAGVADAVARCRSAGVRVVMLTGDHPLTARAVAADAGILDGGRVLTGEQLSTAGDGELDALLERAAAIARMTPLDKVGIVEHLQRLGHVVAMTGDGVNDAPALRLADVGVAMGRHGTEVARGAADVVLADDRFETLVDALVEGRSFWRNIRRALALLLGGNLGELGLLVGASLLGRPAPLTARQILAVNLVTDVLPAVAVAVQPPETSQLSRLSPEGIAGLDAPLRRRIARRGTATAAPSLAAYLAATALTGPEQARGVAFASVVSTQLAQTLDLGRADGSLTPSVERAVAASAASLVAAFALPPARAFLGLAAPGPVALLLVAVASVAAQRVGATAA